MFVGKRFFHRQESQESIVAAAKGALLHYFVTSRKRISVEWEGSWEGLK